jgi:hypothetical protein
MSGPLHVSQSVGVAHKCGWYDERDLYLEPDAAYSVVQRMGDGIGIALASCPDERADRRRLALKVYLGTHGEPRSNEEAPAFAEDLSQFVAQVAQ